ncbi:MAG: hypothetical protein RMM98_05090 [Acidobacteriota bacterium]|nr:hypothetical protein [Blastocatellia bacterium]MDW8238969.1 hypothetical protein [Acidobacteriota bacterium]
MPKKKDQQKPRPQKPGLDKVQRLAMQLRQPNRPRRSVSSGKK